ncbi:MAG: arylsulfatase [Bacteroidota bacterium]
MFLKAPLIILRICIGILLFSYGSANSQSIKPNIIFIMADDLGYGDLGCYGQTKIKTPNIDQLAAQGLRFTQAYAGGPVCTPSRSVLMTGLHNGHTPARDNVPHYHTYLQVEDITVAEVLKQAGYRTGGLGKWSLGDPGTAGDATHQGFDMWLGYQNQDHAHYYYTEYLDDSYRAENNYRMELPGNGKTREFYSHDLLTDRALQFIRDSHNEPFFLYAAYTVPHFSSPSEDPDGLSVPTTDPYTNEAWPEHAKKYASMVHMLDRDVGKIVQLVEQLGLSENTLIIFTSDNGGHDHVWEGFDTNGPLRGYKRDLTEGGIRVPFIARWPGKVPAGTTSDEVIGFQDMLPTFAHLAGAEVPDKLDGINVIDALLGNKLQNPHKYLYWDYGHNRGTYAQAIRMGDWKGIYTKKTGTMELYNLAEDLEEQKDVAKQHPKIVTQIRTYMQEAFVPDDRYEIDRIYTGKAIWKKE